MAGYMYLGNKKVCPAILIGGGGQSDIIPQTVEDGAYKGISITEFKLPDDAITIDSNTNSVLANTFVWDSSFAIGPNWIKSVNLNNLKYVNGGKSFDSMCRSNRSLLSFNAPNLEEIDGWQAFYRVCSKCNNITSVSFPRLKKIIGDSSMRSFIENCPKITTLEFPLLEELGFDNDESIECGTVFSGSCVSNTKLETVRFQSLKYIYPYMCFYQCFYDCPALKDIYFNSLRSDAFGSLDSNQFSDMFGGSTTGVKLHFPANLSSVIPNMDDYPNFGGTNITILYDLPATE